MSRGNRHKEDAVKLSTKGRYAVMAMVDLARHAQAKPVSLSDIATRQEISLSYLEQLFARLRRAELVKSVRGPGGGYRLARASAETRVPRMRPQRARPFWRGCRQTSSTASWRTRVSRRSRRKPLPTSRR